MEPFLSVIGRKRSEKHTIKRKKKSLLMLSELVGICYNLKVVIEVVGYPEDYLMRCFIGIDGNIGVCTFQWERTCV